jgi:sulfur-oxidizing protein SoxY
MPAARRLLITRRDLLIATAGVAVAATAEATPQTMEIAIREVVGDAAVRPGRVTLDIPPIAENGNAVGLTVSVQSPMTQADHVRSIHIFAERNPLPNVAHFHLGPRSGKAEVQTRIRLADTQNIVAIARLSDGSFWSASAQVVITLAACIEPEP